MQLTYLLLLLTYLLLQFLVSIKYSLKKAYSLFYANAKRSSVKSALHTGHATRVQLLGNTSSTGPDLWPMSSPDLTLVYCKILHVIHSEFVVLTLTNWSIAFMNTWCGINRSITENTVDKWRGHLWSCVRKNYKHMGNWCENINILLAIGHVMFHFNHIRYDFWVGRSIFCNF